MKQEKLKNRGITLIALIITIIVMLILVAVTVSVALNGGLIGKTQEAKTKTEEAQIQERDILTGRIKIGDTWYDTLDKYLEGVKSENQNDEPPKWGQDDTGNITYEGEDTGIKIGDYVDYTPIPEQTTYPANKLGTTYTGSSSNSDLTTEDLKWRILGVDENGWLTLISDEPTSETVYFSDATGYNNGVYILNDICEKLYSNTELGIKARSLTIEDVEAGFNSDGIDARNKYTNAVKYGETKTYTTSLQYPVIYENEKGSGVGTTTVKEEGIGGSEPYYTESTLTPRDKQKDTASSNLTCTQTYYYLSTSDSTKYCKNDKFYEMIFKTNTYYWLASRCVDCTSGFANFGLRLVNNAYLYGNYLFDSDGSTYSLGSSLRPAVSLGSNIKLTKCAGENNDTNKHTLSKVTE